MSTDPTPPVSNKLRGVAALVPYRRLIAIALFVVVAALTIILIITSVRVNASNTETKVWEACTSLFCLIGGLFAWLMAPTDVKSEEDRLRVLLLTLGSFCGFACIVLGLVLPVTQYRDVVLGGQKAWRENAWRLTGCVVAVIGGLAVTFASLQLARKAERSSAAMRRVLYGYNAFLSGFLLLIILGLVNVLGYFFLKTTYDWTASGIYTLSPSTRSFLADLKKPVKVYVLLPRNHPLAQDMLTLLDNARSVSNEVSWELLSPDRNPNEILKLKEKYPTMQFEGLLVTYGTEPNLSWDFIKPRDLAESEPPSRRDERPRYVFKGESVLMKSLIYLSEGKARTMVYFTQGAGELPLNPGREMRGGNDVSVLRDRLGLSNYEVKELTLGLKSTRVPRDADVVVIARPQKPFSPEAIKALRDYMNGAGGKKGTLIVLLDVVPRPDGGMVQTGLEGLLRDYHVQVGNNRILMLGNRDNPSQVFAISNGESANPIAQAFFRTRRRAFFLFDDARTISPLPVNPGGRSPYVADALLLVPDPQRTGVIVEKDLNVDPRALARELLKPDNEERAQAMFAREPVPVAVTVAESAGAMPRIPGHEGLLKEKPRLVVFGASDWITSAALRNPTMGRQWSSALFTSCLSWLRGRADIGEKGTETGKVRQMYALGVLPDTVTRITWLPLVLMLLIVVGLGGGVWVVRRR